MSKVMKFLKFTLESGIACLLTCLWVTYASFVVFNKSDYKCLFMAFAGGINLIAAINSFCTYRDKKAFDKVCEEWKKKINETT